MGGFEIEQAALPATRSVALQVGDEMQAGVGDLTATMTSLLDGSWSGQAATAFRSGFEEWQHGAARVLASLRSASDALGATAADYADQDALSAQTLARLNGA